MKKVIFPIAIDNGTSQMCPIINIIISLTNGNTGFHSSTVTKIIANQVFIVKNLYMTHTKRKTDFEWTKNYTLETLAPI